MQSITLNLKYNFSRFCSRNLKSTVKKKKKHNGFYSAEERLTQRSFILIHIYLFMEFKGKVQPENMLISDVRSDKIGKNSVDCFSISLLVLKISAFKVEKHVI